MVWIGSVRCEKFRHDFVARTFALIAPVWLVLQQVSCSKETVPNAPKQKETHQNMCLGSNGVDRECSLRKILTWLRGTNFYITVWHVLQQVSCSRETVPYAPKRKETHQNMSLGSNGVDREHTLRKISKQLHGTIFWINCTSLARFRSVAKQSQMHPNGKKRTKTWV
jgi:hypothetical protein